jgi:hypothetical protein
MSFCLMVNYLMRVFWFLVLVNLLRGDLLSKTFCDILACCHNQTIEHQAMGINRSEEAGYKIN